MASNLFVPESAFFPTVKKIVLFDTNATGQSSIPQRTTEHFELSFFISGSGTFFINGEAHEIKSGAVRFSRPGEIIRGIAPYCCCTIFFDLFDPSDIQKIPSCGHLLENLAQLQRSNAHSHYHEVEILNAFPSFFYTAGNQKSVFLEALDLFYQGGVGSVFRQNALLMSILSGYYYVVKRQQGRSLAVKKCVEYIHEHYAESITLERLSELTNYSTLHIRRKFVAEIGMSPSELTLSVRLTKAKKLLAETSINIIDIATMCGFSSEAYFHTTFKSCFDITPGKYRNMMKRS